MSITLPQRVSLSITGTFNFFLASFSSSWQTIQYASHRCGLPRMNLTTLCSLPTAPKDLHFFFAYSLFSSSVTPAIAGYSSSSLTLGPKSRALVAAAFHGRSRVVDVDLCRIRYTCCRANADLEI